MGAPMPGMRRSSMGRPIRTRRFSTNKTWAESIKDLGEVFSLWGIEHGEWGVTRPESGQRFAEVWYFLPYDPSRKSVSSLAQGDAPTNLRQCVMTLTELQRAAMRGVAIKSGTEEILALAPGAAGPSVVAGAIPPGNRRRSAFRGLREACTVLGITPDTDEQDAIDMRRIKLARFHPENGKETANEEAFKRVEEAWRFIRERKGWGNQE